MELLANVPSARLFDEFLKLFQAGFAEPTFRLLRKYGLFAQLFPETEQALTGNKQFEKFVHAALMNTDRRVKAEKSVTPMFLLGVFLWEPVQQRAATLREQENDGSLSALVGICGGCENGSGYKRRRGSGHGGCYGIRLARQRRHRDPDRR